MKAAQGPIAFVSFRHEIFAAWIPVRVRPKNRNLGPDVMRWMQPAFAQNVRRHRRGCCFAVHPCDDNAALAAHDWCEGFSAAHDWLARISRAYQNRLIDLDGSGKHDQIGVASLVRAMLWKETQT